MSRGIKLKRKYVHISMKEIGRNFGLSAKKVKKELRNVLGILVSRKKLGHKCNAVSL